MLQWTDIVWLLLTGACATLGTVHLTIALRNDERHQHLLLACAIFSVGAIAVIELMMMRAQTATYFAVALRWLHVPVMTLTVSMVVFLRSVFRAGRWWLGALVCAVRGASLVADFTTGVNLNFLSITALESRPYGFGALVVGPAGIVNPWMLLGQLGLLLMTLYAADVAITVYRRGDARTRLGAVFLCFTVAAGYLIGGAGYALAVQAGIGPAAGAPIFFGMVLVMSYELGGDVLRSATLARRLKAVRTDLRDSEQRLEFAEETGGIGLWRWDVAGDQLWLSDSARRVLDIAPGDTLDRMQLLARLPADDIEGLRAALHRACGGDRQINSEFRFRGRAEEYRWLAIRGEVVVDEAAQPQSVRGVVIDVSDRRRADENLRLVFAGAPVAMLMVDGHGRIVLANPRAMVVFGYSLAELQQMQIDALVPIELRAVHTELRDKFARSPSPRAMQPGREVQAVRKDGSVVPVEVSLNPIHFESELLVVAAITDLTASKQIERQLSLQREELAHLSRVAVLAELSGSLAHELNQPLTAILSNAQAALRFLDHRPPNLDEVRTALSNVVDSDKRAGEVIRRLRAMLRKEPPDFIALDINEVVRDVLRIVRSDLLNRNIILAEDLAPGLPLIFGDRVQLQQVLLNLMMNASDSMRELDRDRRLTLSTERSADGIEVRVSDVGTGIAPDDLKRIFTPFVSTKKDGMGLGLAVCQTLVEAHEGRLWASNNAERGATLHILLPITDAG